MNNYLWERHDHSVGRKNGVYFNEPGGGRYQSVSNALNEFFPEKQDSLAAWRARVGENEADTISRISRERGKQFHNLLEKYLYQDDKPIDKIMPATIELFRQVLPIIKSSISDIHLLEAPVYSHKYKMSGRLDMLGEYDDVLSTVDFKNSIKPKLGAWIEEYFLQTAAYSFMLEEMYGVEITQNVILIGVVESAKPQVFKSDPRDLRSHPFFTTRT